MPKNKAQTKQAASKLADILGAHLSQYSASEQDKRIKAFGRAVASNARANAGRGTPATPSRHSETPAIRLSARGVHE
jgi:hypothetical protein